MSTAECENQDKTYEDIQFSEKPVVLRFRKEFDQLIRHQAAQDGLPASTWVRVFSERMFQEEYVKGKRSGKNASARTFVSPPHRGAN